MLARNAKGLGTASSSISLIPSTLPSAPVTISVTTYSSDYLVLSWTSPTNTGIGDTSIAITNYMLEVDEGFGSGFVTLSE